MDHGFSEVISKTKMFELHERFFKLPFQATKCKLAGEAEPGPGGYLKSPVLLLFTTFFLFRVRVISFGRSTLM